MSKVIDFNKFKEKKKVENQISKIRASKSAPENKEAQLARIRESIERVNRLMQELRNLAARHDDRFEKLR